MRKNLDPNNLPEKQHTNPINGRILTEKSCIGQGRAGMETGRPPPINQTVILPSNLSQNIPVVSKIEITNNVDSTTIAHSINKANEGVTHRRCLIPNIPFYLDPTFRLPPKPIRSPVQGNQESSQSSKNSHSTDINPEINLDFEEISPFQEGVISESFQRPDKTFFEELQELQNL